MLKAYYNVNSICGDDNTAAGIGHKAGFATQWMMFLVQVVEPAMAAFSLKFIGSCMMMDLGGWIAFVIFCAVGIAMYIGMSIYRNKKGIELKTFTPDDIVED